MPDWSRVSIGFYGVRKVGKTTTASRARTPFYFDCEDRLKGMDVDAGMIRYTPDTIRFDAALTALEQQTQPDPATGRPAWRKDIGIRTVVWDGMDAVYSKALEDASKNTIHAIGRVFKDDKNPAATNIMAAHQFAADIVARLLYRFLALPAVHIITLHERTGDGDIVKDATGRDVWDKNNNGWKRRRITSPDLAPKILQLLEDRLDVLAYCYFEPTTGRRLMTVHETDTPDRRISAFDCTGRLGWLPGRGGMVASPVPLDWDVHIAQPLRAAQMPAESPQETAKSIQT